MKRLSVITLVLVLALLLSSCALHTGLGGLLHSGSSTTPTHAKHIKATHTPPARSTATSKTAATLAVTATP